MNCSVECKCSRRWMVFADGHTQIAQVIWVWLILPIGNLNTSLLHLAFGGYFDMLSEVSLHVLPPRRQTLRHIQFPLTLISFYFPEFLVCFARPSNPVQSAPPRILASVQLRGEALQSEFLDRCHSNAQGTSWAAASHQECRAGWRHVHVPYIFYCAMWLLCQRLRRRERTWFSREW